MNKLILNSEFNLYQSKDRVFCDSLQFAETFERRHTHVIDTVKALTQPTSGLSENFRRENFIETSYRDTSGKRNKKYLFTKDGFVMVTMEFKTKKARQFKEAYIRRFNQMEQHLKLLAEMRSTFPAFTDAIQAAHDCPQSHHYINECDMINRIVLGIPAAKFRKLHGIPDGQSIRPHLTDEQAAAIHLLQLHDVGLLAVVRDFCERRRILAGIHSRSKTLIA